MPSQEKAPFDKSRWPRDMNSFWKIDVKKEDLILIRILYNVFLVELMIVVRAGGMKLIVLKK